MSRCYFTHNTVTLWRTCLSRQLRGSCELCEMTGRLNTDLPTQTSGLKISLWKKSACLLWNWLKMTNSAQAEAACVFVPVTHRTWVYHRALQGCILIAGIHFLFGSLRNNCTDKWQSIDFAVFICCHPDSYMLCLMRIIPIHLSFLDS